jgi:hypothetical protein
MRRHARRLVTARSGDGGIHERGESNPRCHGMRCLEGDLGGEQPPGLAAVGAGAA